MTPGQLALLTDRILRCIDRVVALGDGLTDERLSAAPGIPGWNSLASIAWHVMANADENILGVARARTVERDRESEFVENTTRTARELRARWADLRPRLEAYFATLGPVELDRAREHSRRGTVTVLELLLVVLRHAAEHEGHAQMTRDYVMHRLPPSA